jgi:hypothetical protein
MACHSQKMLARSLIAIAVLIAGVLIYQNHRPSHVYCSYSRPSGDYTLVVHEYSRPFALPGDSGSGPGYAELFNKDGARIARSSVPSVLDFSDENNIHWLDHRLIVPGMLDLSY